MCNKMCIHVCKLHYLAKLPHSGQSLVYRGVQKKTADVLQIWRGKNVVFCRIGLKKTLVIQRLAKRTFKLCVYTVIVYLDRLIWD